MIKAVLFDLDGTLHDRESSLRRFVAAQHGRLPALRHIASRDYVSRFIELDAHGRVWKDTVYQKLVSEFNISGRTWQELLEDYESEFAKSCVPFPDICPSLAALRDAGFPLGIISNGLSRFQNSVISALGIEHLFDAILISESEGIRKPDPEIFQRALQQLRVSAADAVFVGDDPVADITGAKSAGMKAIWIRNSIWPLPPNADAVIVGLGELPVLIQRYA